MKISILTLHSVCNYGTQLQAFATQETFKKYFKEVGFIDYRRKDTYGIGLIKTFSKGNIIRGIAIIPTIIYWKYIFSSFQKKYLNILKPKHLNDKNITRVKFNADAYVVGSDQVWNSGWNKGVIPTMFLSFISNDKPKYSYSSSFGRKELSQEEISQSIEYIKKFRYISVREESGVDILKKQYNYSNVEKIVDPTLGMPPEFWRKYSGKRKIKGKYILIYNLNRSKDFDAYAEKIAKITGYKLYRFCTRFDQIFKNGKSLIIPKVMDFINYIDNAEIVLTDSFHATAFSINLNTKPICVYPKKYSNRLSEFLKMVDCEKECYSKGFDDFEIINKKVDFKRANEILDNERKKTDTYLKKIKKDIEKFYEK